jgi:hypothetical protein
MTNQRGFLLVPVLIFIFLTLLLIQLGTADLSRSLVMHQLKLHQDCITLLQDLNRIGGTESFSTNDCPVCPLPRGCP